jgi:hypothetical protein
VHNLHPTVSIHNLSYVDFFQFSLELAEIMTVHLELTPDECVSCSWGIYVTIQGKHITEEHVYHYSETNYNMLHVKI